MKAKIIFLMVIIVFFTIFVTQNTLVIPVNIFFWHVEMSVIVLISISSLIGIILGFIFVKLFDTQPKENIKENKPVDRNNLPV